MVKAILLWWQRFKASGDEGRNYMRIISLPQDQWTEQDWLDYSSWQR